MKISHKTSLSFASSSPSLSTIPKFFSVTLLYQQAPLHSPQPDTQESSFFCMNANSCHIGFVLLINNLCDF